jgi:hypothetical protein
MWAPPGRLISTAGTPLLPAPGGLSGRHPGQPGGEGTSQTAEPRHCQTGAAGLLKPLPKSTAPGSRWPKCPPVPPVLSTLVAEVYGPDYDRQRELALKIMTIFEQTDGVVDVDWFMEDEQTRYRRGGPGKSRPAWHQRGPDHPDPAGLALSGRQVGCCISPGKGRRSIVLHRPWPTAGRLERSRGSRCGRRPTAACPPWSLVSPG